MMRLLLTLFWMPLVSHAGHEFYCVGLDAIKVDFHDLPVAHQSVVRTLLNQNQQPTVAPSDSLPKPKVKTDDVPEGYSVSLDVGVIASWSQKEGAKLLVKLQDSTHPWENPNVPGRTIYSTVVNQTFRVDRTGKTTFSKYERKRSQKNKSLSWMSLRVNRSSEATQDGSQGPGAGFLRMIDAFPITPTIRDSRISSWAKDQSPEDFTIAYYTQSGYFSFQIGKIQATQLQLDCAQME